MTGDARIKMKDGRELTVPQYTQYLRESGHFHAPANSLETSDEWRHGMKEQTHRENEVAYTR